MIVSCKKVLRKLISVNNSKEIISSLAAKTIINLCIVCKFLTSWISIIYFYNCVTLAIINPTRIQKDKTKQYVQYRPNTHVPFNYINLLVPKVCMQL